MFTGLIEEIGTVENIKIRNNYAEVEVKAESILEDVKIGDSIATNGVCLTVSNLKNTSFTADIMPESMNRSNLGELVRGSRVNLERAMKSGGRFGGHIVSGHIDGMGRIKSIIKDGNATWLEIEVGKEIMKHIVFKGSVTLDGTSLTVAEENRNSFKVSIIPVTSEETTLLSKSRGDNINIEVDLIGKYIEKLINFNEINTEDKKTIDEDFLKKYGFY